MRRAPAIGIRESAFLATEAAEIDGRFSPDGRWIAYASNQTGQSEIYVRPVDGGGEYRISADGGRSPEWNPTGGAIWFASEERLMVVDIDTSGAAPAVSAERRQTLFPRSIQPNLWAPHPGGDRFLVAQYGDFGDGTQAGERSIRAILNWSVLVR